MEERAEGNGALGRNAQALDEVRGNLSDPLTEANQRDDAKRAAYRRPRHPLSRPNEEITREKRLFQPYPFSTPKFLYTKLGAKDLKTLTPKVLLGKRLLTGLGVGEQPQHGFKGTATGQPSAT